MFATRRRAAVLGGDAGDDRQAESDAGADAGRCRPARTGRTRGPARRRRARGRDRARRRARDAVDAAGADLDRCPGGVWRSALVTRLAIAWRRWSRSPRTTTGSGASRVTGRSGAVGHRVAAGVGGEHGEVDRRPLGRRVWSSRASSSRSSTSVFMRADSSSMRRMITGRSTCSCRARRARNSSAKPWIDVSGVRSSWEASARNWRSRCSVAPARRRPSRSRRASC